MCLRTPEEKWKMSKIPYSNIIESLMYTILYTRPDIYYAAGLKQFLGLTGVNYNRNFVEVNGYMNESLLCKITWQGLIMKIERLLE